MQYPLPTLSSEQHPTVYVVDSTKHVRARVWRAFFCGLLVGAAIVIVLHS